MKITRKSGTAERSVLIGMIVSTKVIGRIAPRWKDDGLFASKWANIVGGWCVEFYKRHGRAPNKNVESMFRSWAEHAPDAQVELVEGLLQGLAGQYKTTAQEMNPDFVLDQAESLFNRVLLAKIRDQLETDLEVGNLTEALKVVSKFNKVEIGAAAPINLLSDETAIVETMTEDKDSVLIRYPGAAGDFFGDALGREQFVAVMGPEKRGKSWVLLDIAYRAVSQRRRVAYFEAGDLSRRQLLKRWYTRIAGRPLKATRKDKPVLWPTVLEVVRSENADGKDEHGFAVEHVARNYDTDLTDKDIQKAIEKFKRDRIKSNKDYLKLSTHSNSSLTVSGMRSILHDWQVQDQWVPDVVVVDYADILAPPVGFKGESRDAVNDNWKAMRRMSQDLHCLVVVGTQANAGSYTSETLGMHNFSEDKRKLSHVTGMLGLNQNNAEKERRVQRWNWLVLREEDFAVTRSLYVAQCLECANACVRSAK